MRPAICMGAMAMLMMCVPPSARAQEQSEESIVVTADRDTEKLVGDFVGAMTRAPRTGNIPRLESDVCPVAIGFAPHQKRMIERRLRQVAKAAGSQVMPEGCAPNAVFIVTNDKAEFISSLARRHPSYFGELMQPSELRRLMREPGPAAAWQVQGFVSAAGIGSSPFDAEDTLSSGLNTGRASRIGTGTRRVIGAALLAVEQGALNGLTTIQLADYAAMRLFARTDPASVPPGVSSILALIDAPAGSEVPVTLTRWDLSFLRALYAAPKSLLSAGQRGEIARRMARELESSGRDDGEAGSGR